MMNDYRGALNVKRISEWFLVYVMSMNGHYGMKLAWRLGSGQEKSCGSSRFENGVLASV